MQHYVIKFVSDLRQAGGVLRVLWFPPPQYNRNIVESGVKYHKPITHNWIFSTPLFSVKYEKIKFLVIALLDSIEIYAWAPKPYHKFMAFKVSSHNVPQFLSTSIWVCISSLLFFHVWPAILFLFTY